jgi:hypothetical protein
LFNGWRLEFAHDIVSIQKVHHVLKVAGAARQQISHLMQFHELARGHQSFEKIDVLAQ